ncbi:hypothetical protein D3C74_370680 [compost metagenome]
MLIQIYHNYPSNSRTGKCCQSAKADCPGTINNNVGARLCTRNIFTVNPNTEWFRDYSFLKAYISRKDKHVIIKPCIFDKDVFRESPPAI